MSLPSDHTCCLGTSELESVSAFSCVRKPYSNATIGVVLSLSSSSNSSIRCCPPTIRPSTQAAHRLLWTASPQLVGFFGFILTLGISASKGSSSSSLSISTSARDSPTGSRSPPIGAPSRFRVFVGTYEHSALPSQFPDCRIFLAKQCSASFILLISADVTSRFSWKLKMLFSS